MLWWFTETTLVAGALALAAALASRLRVRWFGPAARHALWLVVLVKLVTPPLVSAPWALPVPAAAEPAVVAQEPVEPDPLVDATATAENPDHAHNGAGILPPLSELLVVRVAHDDESEAAEPGVVVERARVSPAHASILSRLPHVDRAALGRGLLALWAATSALVLVVQAVRVARFARRLRSATAAPAWLIQETEQLAARMGVRTPEALVVRGIGVPMLWCLGRPRLLLPEHLIDTLEPARWRGVIAHELAHVRRGDPWVSRLALLAGLAWWWNPLYWLARRALDAEAELACDAWVVWALPDDRVVYAGTMLEICETLCRKNAPSLAPAFGGSDSGRLFERRLTMILNDRVPCRLTWPGLIAPGLLVLLGLPSWTITAAPPEKGKTATVTVTADDDKTKDKDQVKEVKIGRMTVVVSDDDAKPAAAASAEGKTAAGEVALAESNLKRAKDRAEWAEKMLAKGYVSAAQSRTEQLSVEEATAALAQARAKHARVGVAAVVVGDDNAKADTTVKGKIYVVKPGDSKPVELTIDSADVVKSGDKVVKGKILVVKPDDPKPVEITIGKNEGLTENGEIYLYKHGKPGEAAQLQIIVVGDDDAALKEKVKAAHEEAQKHIEAIRAESKVMVEKARKALDEATAKLKRAKAEAAEAQNASRPARAEAEKGLAEANTRLAEARLKLEAAEKAAASAGKVQMRVEVRKVIKTDAANPQIAELNAQLARAKARLEQAKRLTRSPQDPALKAASEKVEKLAKELEAAKAKAGAQAQVRVEVHEDSPAGAADKPRAEIRRGLEIRRRDKDNARPKARAEAEDDDDDDIDLQIRDFAKLFSPDSDLMKHLQDMGPAIEKKLREKLGPGTKFDEKMKSLGDKLGKELEEHLGKGSDFDKAMKELAKSLEETFGPGSDFEKQVKEFAGEGEPKVKEKEKAKDSVKEEAKPKPKEWKPEAKRPERPRIPARARAIEQQRKAMEAQIKALQEQLKRLDQEQNAGDYDNLVPARPTRPNR